MPFFDKESLRRTFLIGTEFDCYFTGIADFHEGTNEMLDAYDVEHAPDEYSYFYGDMQRHIAIVRGFATTIDEIRTLPQPTLKDVLDGGHK
jgi:hypothetical protein